MTHREILALDCLRNNLAPIRAKLANLYGVDRQEFTRLLAKIVAERLRIDEDEAAEEVTNGDYQAC